MLTNILAWLAVCVLLVLLGWLTVRSFRGRHRFLKWLWSIPLGLLTLILLLVVVTSGLGLIKLYRIQNIPVPEIIVAATPEQISRGEHVAATICASCHSPNNELPLSGGEDVGKESPVPIGSLIAFNLTPGGPLKDWSDGEIFRAVRRGVDRHGNFLVAMTGLSMRNLSDDDLQAVIAYLRSQPSIASVSKEGDYPNLIFAIFLGANLAPIPEPVIGVITAPDKSPSAEYGKYIISYTGCHDCHGEDLAGGASGGLTPVGPSLRIVKGWSKEQFIATIRTGTDPTGHQLKPPMAWEIYAHLDDEELTAVYAYLTSLE
jgi:mono/diheme cytochrome c family protein